jgi:parallel beta-helix repeat protein
MWEAANNAIRRVTVQSNAQQGIQLDASDDNLIEQSFISANVGFGIRLDTRDFFSTVGSNGNRIEMNVISGNGANGISMFRASDTLVSKNKLTGNARGNDSAIAVLTSPNTRIEKNWVVNNATFGIVLDNSQDALVEHNVVRGNFGGIVIEEEARHNTVIQNAVHNNRSFGIQISFTGPNLIERNLVSQNGSAGHFISSGLYVSGTGNQILGNTVNGNNRDGVLLRDAQGTRVARNRASRNRDDGIDSQGANTIAANTADRNGDYGIEATPEVIDGGGNRAKGNGNPAQCLNVACK